MDIRRTDSPRGHSRVLLVVALLFLVLIGGRTAASYVIEYQWWQEMGQVSTWFNMLLYGTLPVAAASLLAAVLFWLAHMRGVKFSGSGRASGWSLLAASGPGIPRRLGTHRELDRGAFLRGPRSLRG